MTSLSPAGGQGVCGVRPLHRHQSSFARLTRADYEAAAEQNASRMQRGTTMNRTYDDTMFRDTFEHEYTWLNGFTATCAATPKKVAMIDPATNRSWNYNELNHEANRLAHALAADGVGKNDVVMTSLFNCPEFRLQLHRPRKLGGHRPTPSSAISTFRRRDRPHCSLTQQAQGVYLLSDIAPMAAQEFSLALPRHRGHGGQPEKVPLPAGTSPYEGLCPGSAHHRPGDEGAPPTTRCYELCTSAFHPRACPSTTSTRCSRPRHHHALSSERL